MSKSNYITPAGRKRLADELYQLWNVERPKITQEVADAAAEGDRSENAAYIYGKKRLREIDRRVRFLSKRLEALTVVEPAVSADGRAYFGLWARVCDENGVEAEYQLVGPDELDVAQGKISIDSPVGRALLGKKKGDAVTVHRPKGPLDLDVLDVFCRLT